MLETQKILVENKSLPEKIFEELGINMTRHKKYPNLVMFRYDQIKAINGNSVVNECRGLILDENDNWKVISYPYKRFRNAGEFYADTIDWQTATVVEKLDGSLMTLYYYDGQWQVASSGSPDASGEVWPSKKTFAELFWETWKKCGYKMPNEAYKHKCFIFELTTPENKIVVPYQEYKLVLHGVRSLNDFIEESPDFWGEFFGWNYVKQFQFKTIEECNEAAKQLNPGQQEGFVVVDDKFNRIKVKSPAYVALHQIKENFTDSGLLKIIQTNESEEFLTYFPEMRPSYEAVKSKYNKFISLLEESWRNCINRTYDHNNAVGKTEKEVRKNFALVAIESKMPSCMFALLDKHTNSVREFLADQDPKKLVKLL